ncbi:alpha/beta hydrolase [Pseudonocardia charpentierae]|uniref:Alpha/beta hydrolase n=1 Tax=Pseudonocardia charpentierae TaxID=3075545 RepID=A0ABU2N5K5_9PSEU|nr:alpha/beta hydrolase [Pseudonocardia sp. DSM 45834]MDT0347994.1 alpha/beta hydrolase [Pseudonocardia sp. DSM 45834]
MTEISRNGRTVAVHDLTPGAPADAPVVLMCHAAPGSGSFDPDPEVTAAAGIRLIEVDRPGYGGSDPVKDGFATIGLAADDAAAVLADVLPPGGRAGVAGWSAGGRVALALAARHPELVGRVAVIAAPAPDEEVPWYGDENRAMVDALRGLPPADAVARLTAVFEGMLADAGGGALLGLAGVADADADVLTAPVRERLRAMLDAATAQGVTGMVADLAGYTLADWGFTSSQVAADVLLAYGADDALVPPAHGEWYRDRLPSAQLEIRAGVGHLVVVPVWSRVLAYLVR